MARDCLDFRQPAFLDPPRAARSALWQDTRATEVATLPSTLVCHPLTPAAAVRRLTAHVARAGAAALDVGFVLEGDLPELAIPSAGPPTPGERLWEHTCFELFVAADGLPAYHEVNLAPSGAWQAHAFARYRDGGPLADAGLAPRIAVERGRGRLTLQARIALHRLSPRYATTTLRLALAAVVEHASGTRSYWALRHPPARPDFHHPDGFILTLDAPATPARNPIP